MNILVLGGNGFIGRHFIDRLMKTPNSINILGRSQREELNSETGIRQIKGSYLDEAVLVDALDQVDQVVHLVSTTVPATAQKDFAYDIESNLVGTIRLVEKMLDRGIKRIVFVSSGGTVYGNPEGNPVPESHPLRPMNAYGVTKVAIEHALNMYRQTRGLEPVILRVANAYGEGPVKHGLQGIIGNFMHAIRNGKPITVFGDGSVVRDYVYTGDVADALMLALESPAATYNIGTGKGSSINNVIQLLGEITGRVPNVEYLPANPYDVPALVLDPDLARKKLGWTPVTGLEQGLQRTWDWFQSR